VAGGGALLDRGAFPLVLGGDDSVLFGNLLALRRRGRYGLVFLDAHTDFYLPEQSPTGQASDCDLALATGRGPAVIANLDGLSPLVRDEDVAVLGAREAAGRAVRHVLKDGVEGLWLHLDADVLVIAPDIAEADEIEHIASDPTFAGGRFADKVLTVHSKQPEEALAQLDRLEEPDNPYRIVVSVRSACAKKAGTSRTSTSLPRCGLRCPIS
jgi:Arginase family